MNYKETVNLPQTDFPIRAGLTEKEPEIQKNWVESSLYDKQILQESGFSQSYILHDGPPYPNGNIHMGHALNKVLKDIIIRTKILSGQKSIFVPGWDCHGLPIEVQVQKELKRTGEEHKKQDLPWFRNKCKQFALDYVDTQRNDFKRLGIQGEWNAPYLTLNPHYEANVIRLFGQLAENGLVYKGRKPIHWCIHCETALAEAEIDYAEHRSPSIFVTFSIQTPTPELSALIQNNPAHLLVWTTTPWTLPANVAIAAHPTLQYAVIRADNTYYVCAKSLVDSLQETLGFESVSLVGTLSGQALQGTVTQHPLFDRTSAVYTADYVTEEDGTGFVHIAPGHGQDDYHVGLTHHLPILMPVNDQGRFTQEAGPFEGMLIFDANKAIGEAMTAKGTLKKLKFIKHSYPHCWRCKNPVIFRATEQWFIAMDTPMPDGQTLREKALTAIRNTKWYPSWGENRITSMIENRPDWCISRQRFWGIPIPVFHCTNCGHSEMTGSFNQAVQHLVREKGTLAWFEEDAASILTHQTCSQCGGSSFKKETDILDVWFESGASFGSVLEQNPDLGFPADLYLEGSDQHRGWFQSSLLIGLGATGKAPFKAVLTHGFIVDEKGKKMSKSEGNVISPEEVIKEYGADILRWWIASSDFKNDISLSKNIMNQARDTFSKVRNTIRFCLSNLYDFNPQDGLAFEDQNEIDRWALLKLSELDQKVQKSYAAFEFHLVTYALHDFCAVTLSALYLDMMKDRLYCDQADGKNRRSTQTSLFIIAKRLMQLISPILVHTAEDAYSYFQDPAKAESIHLLTLDPLPQAYQDPALQEKWEKLLHIKNAVYQQLEVLRNQKEIKSFLEAQVQLTLDTPLSFDDWEALLIVSKVSLSHGNTLQIMVSKAQDSKCERCWKVLPVSDQGLCERCTQALAKVPS